MKAIQDLINISQFYGSDPRYVIAGGGNTSYKTDEKLWIKASGSSLATISEDGFAILDRSKLNEISHREYSSDVALREEQVKDDLMVATITKDKRPSVETSMHNAIKHSFVVHLHPTIVNGLMCSSNAYKDLIRLFGKQIVFIEYTDPGYVLFKKVEQKITEYRSTWHSEPQIIWLENHGIFVAAESIKEIKDIYNNIFNKIEEHIIKDIPVGENIISDYANDTLTSIKSIFTSKVIKARSNQLIQYYSNSVKNQQDVSKPFTPDAIVYCKSKYIFINEDSAETVINVLNDKVDTFLSQNGYLPKVILINRAGLFAVEDSDKQCDIVLDVFEDAMKIAFLSLSFGGPQPMTQEQIDFIDNWEVENYRRSVSASDK